MSFKTPLTVFITDRLSVYLNITRMNVLIREENNYLFWLIDWLILLVNLIYLIDWYAKEQF